MQTSSLAVLSNIDLLIFVDGIEGAKSYQIGPNCRLPLFDKNKDIMYIKKMDANGYLSSLDAYKFEKIALVNKEESPTGISLNDIRQIIKEEMGSIKEELVNGQQSIIPVDAGTNESRQPAVNKNKQSFKPKHESANASGSNTRRDQQAANSESMVNG